MTARKRQIIRPTPGPQNELPPREKIIAQEGDDGTVGDEEGEGVDAGARDQEAYPLPPGGSNVRVTPEGELKPDRAWRLAVAWADGFRGLEAWEMTGGGAGSYRSRIETNEVFQQKVGEMEAEKKKLEQVGFTGEAMWAAKQNLRLARIAGVQTEIHRATLLFVETVKSFSGVSPAEPGGERQDGEAPRAPGRPPNQPKALRVDVAQMRESLLNKGIAAPAVAAE